MTKAEIENAIDNATPKEPVKYELGGDYYYRCHWLKCNEQLKRYWQYCPNCGQKIEWRDE